MILFYSIWEYRRSKTIITPLSFRAVDFSWRAFFVLEFPKIRTVDDGGDDRRDDEDPVRRGLLDGVSGASVDQGVREDRGPQAPALIENKRE